MDNILMLVDEVKLAACTNAFSCAMVYMAVDRNGEGFKNALQKRGDTNVKKDEAAKPV